MDAGPERVLLTLAMTLVVQGRSLVGHLEVDLVGDAQHERRRSNKHPL